MMEALIAVLALTAMEIVLGIDNIVFIAIVSARLPEAQRPNARRLGLIAALVMRILLLFTISWVMRADSPLFHWSSLLGDFSFFIDHEELNDVSLKDLILFFGGLFLIWKSVFEIHEKLEGHPEGHGPTKAAITFSGVIMQIMVLDLVFSLDSVITAVGMIKSEVAFLGYAIPGIWLMVTAVLISVGVWMHGKAQAGAWQAYIRDKLSAALSKRSAWFLFLLAFVVVYREVFETILFYAALWSQGGQLAMVSGAGLAVICLAVIAWALLSYSKRLPIAQFFSYSSILIAVLAVVLAGKGVAGLQEAGMLDVRPLAALPRIEVLGVFPTWEGLLAQLLTLTVVVVGFWAAGRRAQAEARV